jgi:hypothetical protein
VTIEPVFPTSEGKTMEEKRAAVEQYMIDREQWLAENGVARITSKLKPDRSWEIGSTDCENVAFRVRYDMFMLPNGFTETVYLLMRVGG